VQLTEVDTAAGLAIAHVAPGSVPAPGVTVHVDVSPELSGSVTEPAIAIVAPSWPEYGPPALTVGSTVNRTLVQPGRDRPVTAVTLAAQVV
jgi:hypothetical protein